MRTERAAIGSLRPDPKNARKHGSRNLQAIKKSLQAFGQQKPIIVDASGTVVAGNGTLEAARLLGWATIEIVRTNLVGSKARAFALADNRTAELAEWDDAELISTLKQLAEEDKALMDAAGFDDEALLKLMGPPEGLTDPDAIPEPPKDAITKSGDLWILGDHRLLCGDSTKAEDVGRVMHEKNADVCFTSPPYAQQRDYGKKIADWDGLMRDVFGNLPMSPVGQVLVNLGLIHQDGEVCAYWDSWIEWMRGQGWKHFGWYVWDKISATFKANDGRLWMSHEWVFHFNKQTSSCVEWVDCKHAGEDRGIWGQRKPSGRVARLSTPGKIKNKRPADSVARIQRETNNSDEDVRSHPARFPIALAEHFLRSWDGLIYEPFLGSGTTLIAAERLGRRCFGIEIEPRYCDVIVRRWEEYTGRKAVLEKSSDAKETRTKTKSVRRANGRRPARV